MYLECACITKHLARMKSWRDIGTVYVIMSGSPPSDLSLSYITQREFIFQRNYSKASTSKYPRHYSPKKRRPFNANVLIGFPKPDECSRLFCDKCVKFKSANTDNNNLRRNVHNEIPYANSIFYNLSNTKQCESFLLLKFCQVVTYNL